MKDYRNDNRIVLTLDAGGTNMVFGAMKGGEFITESITLPSNSSDLDLCLQTMVDGFKSIIEAIGTNPDAISFAFPGPADYPNGIIGGYLPNFPSFRDGVALGPFLSRTFGVPVFINNDGDLFGYGEAIGGMLPEINARLEKAGSAKRYKNMIGYTFGTGFGIGVVVNGELNRGDNSCVETFCLPHKDDNNIIVEEGVAVRAVKRVYAELSGDKDHKFEPKDIFDIAEGKLPGDVEAAKEAFRKMGEVAGDAMATAVTLTDGLIVIGGGITAAKKYIMPGLLAALRSKMHTLTGDELDRVQMKVYDLDDETEFAQFAKGSECRIKIYGSEEEVTYDPQKRIGVCISKMGASKAISTGAWLFALDRLDAGEDFLYPMKFEPYLKSVIWGGSSLPGFKGVETDQEKIGESWELSGVKGHESIVANGPLAGKNITELIDKYQDKLVGSGNWNKDGNEFPLLIKFIDAEQDLSLQVHPDDKLAALRHNGSKGKSEMWYIIDAKPGAHLLSGLSQEINPLEYEKRVRENTITDVIASHNIKAGDVYNLPAGRIHAICAGTLLAEIQETSDITYRIYDYNRPGLDGKPRELHTELAKDAIDYRVYDDYKTHYHHNINEECILVQCEHFTTSLLNINKEFYKDISYLDSFLILICTEGEGKVHDNKGNCVPMHRGETMLIPASTKNIRIVPDGKMKVLTSFK